MADEGGGSQSTMGGHGWACNWLARRADSQNPQKTRRPGSPAGPSHWGVDGGVQSHLKQAQEHHHQEACCWFSVSKQSALHGCDAQSGPWTRLSRACRNRSSCWSVVCLDSPSQKVEVACPSPPQPQPAASPETAPQPSISFGRTKQKSHCPCFNSIIRVRKHA